MARVRARHEPSANWVRRRNAMPRRYAGSVTDGPRLRSRGTLLNELIIGGSTALQWGRDFAVAELSFWSRATITPTGFNGAATSQSRNSLRHSWSIDRARGSARVAVRGARPRRVSATVRNISRKPYRPLRWPTSAMASRGRPHASTADHTGTEAQHSRLAAALEGREAPRSGSPSRGRTWHGRTIPETDA